MKSAFYNFLILLILMSLIEELSMIFFGNVKLLDTWQNPICQSDKADNLYVIRQGYGYYFSIAQDVAEWTMMCWSPGGSSSGGGSGGGSSSGGGGSYPGGGSGGGSGGESGGGSGGGGPPVTPPTPPNPPSVVRNLVCDPTLTGGPSMNEFEIKKSTLFYKDGSNNFLICEKNLLTYFVDDGNIYNLLGTLLSYPYRESARCSFGRVNASQETYLVAYISEGKLILTKILSFPYSSMSVLKEAIIDSSTISNYDILDCYDKNMNPTENYYFCFYAASTPPPQKTHTLTWVHFDSDLGVIKRKSVLRPYKVIKTSSSLTQRRSEYFVYVENKIDIISIEKEEISEFHFCDYDQPLLDFEVGYFDFGDPIVIARINDVWVIAINYLRKKTYMTKVNSEITGTKNKLSLRSFSSPNQFSLYFYDDTSSKVQSLHTLSFPTCIKLPNTIELKTDEEFSMASLDPNQFTSPAYFILISGRIIPNKFELFQPVKLEGLVFSASEGNDYDWSYILRGELAQSDVTGGFTPDPIDKYFYSSTCNIQFRVCYGTCSTCTEFGNENDHKCLTCKKYYKMVGVKCVLDCPVECSCKQYDQYLYFCANCRTKEKKSIPIDEKVNDLECYTEEEMKEEEAKDNESKKEELKKEDLQSVEDIEKIKDDLYQLYPGTPIVNLPNCTVQIIDSFQTDDDAPSNVSRINLGECENILREAYDIPKDEALLITKIDVVLESQLTNKVSYSVHKRNGTKLDMSLCDKTPIKIKSPINNMPDTLKDELQSFDTIGVDLYNKSGTFFNSRCSNYTSTGGTDVPLKDRRKDLSKNSSSLCSGNCNYNGINLTENTVSCQCFSNEEASAETRDNFNELVGSFLGVLKDSNFDVVTCFNLVFDIKILSHNIGSWFVLSVISLCGINSFYFLFSQIGMLFPIFYKVVFDIAKNDKPAPHLKSNPAKKKKVHRIEISSFSEDKNLKSKQELSMTSRSVKPIQKTIDKKYSIEDLNEMEFNDAIIYDTRNYPKMYLGFLLMTQPILETFVYKSKKNLRSIKISMFFFGFVLDFSLSAFFYSDEYISNNYQSGGDFSFFDNLPVSLYTYVFGMIISLLFNLLSNPASLDKLSKITDQDELMIRVKSYVTCYRVKLVFYFIIQLAFLCGFWYYVAAFCSVYQNSQTAWLISGFTSAGLSMALPFAFSIILSLIRYISIRCKCKCLFRFISVLMIVIECI